LTFKRTSGNEEIIVAINTTSAPFFGSTEAAGVYQEITPHVEGKTAGLPSLSLESFGYRIFRRKN
jgi:hypothetical protein